MRWAELSGLKWGTVFPVFTNMTVIAITYSCIAPLVLGFSSLGLYLVYQAYRYNLLFVYDQGIDTMGLIYPRALQQVLTGIYLAQVCLIGLFAIKGAIGPLVLMVMFVIVTVLAHISLNDALNPLLSALPRTLDRFDTEDDGGSGSGQYGLGVSSKKAEASNSFSKGDKNNNSDTINSEYNDNMNNNNNNNESNNKERIDTTNLNPPAHTTVTCAEISPISPSATTNAFAAGTANTMNKARNSLTRIISRFFHPNIYADYSVLRKKVRQGGAVIYSEQVADEAYFPPSVTSKTPLLWIPRDAGGLSRQEVEMTSEVIPITDEEAHLDEKNKVIWDKVGMRPPIWRDRVHY